MTPKQKRVLDAVRDLTVDGVSPSLDEIAAHLGLVKSNVHRFVEELLAQGRLIREPMSYRSLRVAGAFDQVALDNMCHADLLALKAAVDRRLCA